MGRPAYDTRPAKAGLIRRPRTYTGAVLQAPPPPPPTSLPPPQWQAPPAAPYPAPAYSPEPDFVVRYAGFWIRTAAYVIDSILLSVAWFLLILVFAIIAVIVNPNAVNDSQSASVNLTSDLAGLLVTFGYFAGLWTLNGATYGQRWLGMRVVDAATFQPPRPAQAALRWLGLWLSFAALCIGVIWVAFDPRKQGWMDKLAGTVVVRPS